MTVVRTVQGHTLTIEKTLNLRGHYRVCSEGHALGMIAFDVAGWHTVPAPGPDGPRPVLHSPTLMLALAALVFETLERSNDEHRDDPLD